MVAGAGGLYPMRVRPSRRLPKPRTGAKMTLFRPSFALISGIFASFLGAQDFKMATGSVSTAGNGKMTVILDADAYPNLRPGASVVFALNSDTEVVDNQRKSTASAIHEKQKVF